MSFLSLGVTAEALQANISIGNPGPKRLVEGDIRHIPPSGELAGRETGRFPGVPLLQEVFRATGSTQTLWSP